MRWTASYHVACQLQNKLLDLIGVPRPFNPKRAGHPPPEPKAKGLKPKDLTAMIASWEKLEERKRILRMKPKPKAADVTPRAKPRAHVTFRE